MSIATAPRRQTSVAAVASRKRFFEIRLFRNNFTRWTKDQPSLFTLKFNPRWSESLDTPGTTVDFAEAVILNPSEMDLDIDATGQTERQVSLVIAKTVQEVIDFVNAPNANGAQYWTAGVADFAPGVEAPTSLDNTNLPFEQSLLVGFEDNIYVPIAVNLSNSYNLAAGVQEAKFGTGDIPHYLDTDYNYPLTPATNPLQVGSGGGISGSQGEDLLAQRAGKFGTREQVRAAEMNPADARFLTVVDSIGNGGMVAGANEPLVYEIMEADGSVAWRAVRADSIEFIKVPSVACRGPAFLKVTGQSGGSFTTGFVTMQGDIRVA